MDDNTKTVLWIISIIVSLIFIGSIASNNSDKTKASYNDSYSTPTYTTTTKTTTASKVEAKTEPEPITWYCIDATSYNKNPYDDNMCTSSTGEVRYVSDSQARVLDPDYVPGAYGHPYYNSK